MIIYKHNAIESSIPNYDYVLDIRACHERMLNYQNEWIHWPYRLICEGHRLPFPITIEKNIYVFDGCPLGYISKKAVDHLFQMGYSNCFTITS